MIQIGCRDDGGLFRVIRSLYDFSSRVRDTPPTSITRYVQMSYANTGRPIFWLHQESAANSHLRDFLV